MIYLVLAGALAILVITTRAGIKEEDLAYYLLGYIVWCLLFMGLFKAFQVMFL